MNHDPLCPFAQWDDQHCYQRDAGVLICDLIAKVRVDESSDCAEHEIQIRKQTINRCIAEVESLFGPEDYELRWLLDGEAVLDALRALQEKP